MALDRTWYNSLVNDDGSGLTGSVWDKEDVNQLMNAIDAEIARISVPPYCFVYANGAQSFAHGAWDYVNFAAAFENGAGMWSSGAPNAITIPVAGHYYVNGCIYWAGNPTGARMARILYNYQYNILADVRQVPIGADNTTVYVSGIINAAAGAIITMQAYQSSGAALGAGGTFPGTNYLQIYRAF